MNLDARSRLVFVGLVAFIGALPHVAASQGRDGRLFDPGTRRATRAEKAPPQLDEAAFLIGEWDVTCSHSAGEAEAVETRGVASITYVNRGHGIMERYYSADGGDGHPAHELRLLAFNPPRGVWSYGEASSWTESTRAMSAPPSPAGIVLYDGIRPGGGPTLELLRRTTAAGDAGTFTTTEEVSTDMGATWTARLACDYAAREDRAAALVPSDDLGAPAPTRPDAAAGFDFLLGEHDARHWILFQGREVRFPSTTTAVYALGGHGILEFDRLDVDPGLPDAATTVVRLYNRAQRRWESLFVNNRFNSILRFGGRQEGERIVLTNFAVGSVGTFPRFVFHDIGDAGYRWYSERSGDRGRSFEKTWTIDVSFRDTSR